MSHLFAAISHPKTGAVLFTLRYKLFAGLHVGIDPSGRKVFEIENRKGGSSLSSASGPTEPCALANGDGFTDLTVLELAAWKTYLVLRFNNTASGPSAPVELALYESNRTDGFARILYGDRCVGWVGQRYTTLSASSTRKSSLLSLSRRDLTLLLRSTVSLVSLSPSQPSLQWP